MKIMVVASSEVYAHLAEIMKKLASVEDVVYVQPKENLAGLLEHRPTHAICEWEDGSREEKNWEKNWEVFLTNAQMLGVKVIFISWQPARVLPEAARPLHLRLPVRAANIMSILERR